MNVTMQKKLLTISAALECLTGVVIILLPGLAIAVLLGLEAPTAALMIGRMLGVALLSLGIACWGAAADTAGPARTGTLRAITLYDAGAGLALVAYAAMGMAHGWLPWVAGVLHLILAGAFLASGRFGNSVNAKSSI